MAQILIRNLNESTKVYWQRRAKRNGRSMEAEVREILVAEEHMGDRSEYGMGSRIVAMVKAGGVFLEEPIPEIRDEEMNMRIPEFEP